MNLDYGFAAGCAAVALPRRGWLYQFTGLRPYFKFCVISTSEGVHVGRSPRD